MQAAVRRALAYARSYAAEHRLQGKLVQACPLHSARLNADGTVHDPVWIVRCTFKRIVTRKSKIVSWQHLLDKDSGGPDLPVPVYITPVR